MSTDKLVIEDMREGWIVGWLVDCEGEVDLGAYLGDGVHAAAVVEARVAAAKTAEDYNNLEHEVASLAAAEVVAGLTKDMVHRSSAGYFFERRADAVAAKKAAEVALKALRARAKQVGKPWPLWAITAKAAGWEPPEGWKP